MAKDQIRRAIVNNKQYIAYHQLAIVALTVLYLARFIYANGGKLNIDEVVFGAFLTVTELASMYILLRDGTPTYDADGNIESVNELKMTELPKIQSTAQDCLWASLLIRTGYLGVSKGFRYLLVVVPILIAVTFYRCYSDIRASMAKIASLSAARAQPDAAPAAVQRNASDEKRKRRQDLREKRMGIAAQRM